MKKGFISNLQFYSTKDGPGIRTTVFCSGCNLKCAWCANPELISGKRNFFHYKQRCIHCGSCVNIASHAITFANQGCLIDRSQSLIGMKWLIFVLKMHMKLKELYRPANIDRQAT